MSVNKWAKEELTELTKKGKNSRYTYMFVYERYPMTHVFKLHDHAN